MAKSPRVTQSIKIHDLIDVLLRCEKNESKLSDQLKNELGLNTSKSIQILSKEESCWLQFTRKRCRTKKKKNVDRIEETKNVDRIEETKNVEMTEEKKVQTQVPQILCSNSSPSAKLYFKASESHLCPACKKYYVENSLGTYCPPCEKEQYRKQHVPTLCCIMCNKFSCGGVRCAQCKRRTVRPQSQCCIESREKQLCVNSWLGTNMKIALVEQKSRQDAYKQLDSTGNPKALVESVSRCSFTLREDLQNMSVLVAHPEILKQLTFCKWTREDHTTRDGFEYKLGVNKFLAADEKQIALCADGLHFTSIDFLEAWGQKFGYGQVCICLARLERTEDVLWEKYKVVTVEANVIEFIESK